MSLLQAATASTVLIDTNHAYNTAIAVRIGLILQ
jgi:hypothetical protein